MTPGHARPRDGESGQSRRRCQQSKPGSASRLPCDPDCFRSPAIHLSKLVLSGFRNHVDTKLELGPGITVFCGANGQGKSNLLEAAYLLAIAKSPRTSSGRELVNWAVSEKGGHVQVLGVGREGDTTIQAQVDIDVAAPGAVFEDGDYSPIRKTLRVNGIQRSAAEFVGKLNVVFFEATDLQLVMGGSAERRRFLDILISQTDSGYLKALQRYHQVVYQRNGLLRRVRDGRAGEDELEFWDDRLAVEGAAIIDRRRRVVAELDMFGVEEHRGLTGGQERLGLVYKPKLTHNDDDPAADFASAPADRLSDILSDSLGYLRKRELAQGISLVGPHRDDLLISLNDQAADSYASRGQARSIALALKLAEAASVAAATGRKPVVALDDVMSEFDPARRRLVLERASQYEQVLLTSTEFEVVDQSYLGRAARYTVSAGRVIQA
ncbi:MAG: DNA replication/repair protein RecF [Dehalococcoidia bacterium]|nr:DNA replication/repair protein RecF [Dehalococcoidia bacterium]MSQ34703.1 DNA replication/repair protein RecF [Dehalococcoidia bacterium]